MRRDHCRLHIVENVKMSPFQVYATVAEVHEQGLAVTSGRLLTRLPWLRRPPVFCWILLLVALSTSFHHRLLLLGDAG